MKRGVETPHFLTGIILVMCLAILWQALARYGVIGPLYSSPQRVWRALVAMQTDTSPTLLTHVFATMIRTIIATASGVTIGFVLGCLAAGRAAYLVPLGAFVAAIPGLVWLKMLIVPLGFDDLVVIGAGAIMALMPMMTHTERGIRSIPDSVVWSAELMGADANARRFEVKLMWALPSLLIGLRLSFARAWRAVLVTEFVGGATVGLGLTLMEARGNLRVDRVYAGLILMGLIFFVIERWGLRLLEREVAFKWGQAKN